MLRTFLLMICFLMAYTVLARQDEVVLAKLRHLQKSSSSDQVPNYMREALGEDNLGDRVIDFRGSGAIQALQQDGLKVGNGEVVVFLTQESANSGYYWQIDRDEGRHAFKVLEVYATVPQEGEKLNTMIPKTKMIKIIAGNEHGKGEALFRMVRVRPSEFLGFQNFKPEAYSSWNIVEFTITVV